MKRSLGLAGALVALVALAALAVWLGSDTAPAPRPVLKFAEGRRYVYALSLAGESTVAISASAKPLSGTFEVEGELVIDGRSGAVDLGLERLGRAQMSLMGQQGDETQELQGRRARVALGADGKWGDVELAATDPLVFKNTVQALLGELQLGWGPVERTPRGEAELDTRAFTAGLAEKVRRRYLSLQGLGAIGDQPSLDARAFFTFAPEGHLVRLDALERLDGGPGRTRASLRVTLALKSVGPVPAEAPVAPIVTQRVEPAVVVPDPGAEISLLNQQVDGLTPELLGENLSRYAIGAPIPKHNHFLVQAVALLTLHPELCDEMARRAMAENTSLGRSLALDLLANTGTPKAQEALVAAINSDAVQRDPKFVQLTFRLSMVRRPTEQTVAATDAALLRSAEPERHGVFAVSLGALAGARLHREDSPAAREAMSHLRDDLRRSSGGRDTTNAVLALGNAGLADDVGLLQSYAHANDSEVRRAVADATRKMGTAAAQQLALGLTTDADPGVQQAALAALAHYSLEGEPLRALRDEVLQGHVAPESYNALLTTLSRYATTPEGRAILEYLARPDVPVADMRLKTRARNMLRRS